jgi:hypothetical protein
MHKNVLLAVVLSSFFWRNQSGLDQHPIILEIHKYFLETPRDRKEQPTTATILGITCKGSITVSAFIASTGSNDAAVELNYSKSVFLDPRNNPDDCLDITVPDIDTKFILTFEDSNKPDRIPFTGEVPALCKECKPKRTKKISGLLRKAGKSKYHISFTGDLADSLDLIATN